jgi:hypothetical protein
MSEQECPCLLEPLKTNRYNQVQFIGLDETNGRFGEVNLWQCKSCRRYWLHYLIEYEAFQRSGRYFMGLITKDIADALSPDTAIDYLDKLDWHLYGGSYFGKKGRSTDRVNPDL